MDTVINTRLSLPSGDGVAASLLSKPDWLGALGFHDYELLLSGLENERRGFPRQNQCLLLSEWALT